ncbi:MAG: hypothetical protein M0042_05265 [Nitrospiraceae bacterium]|nr:hypothetical protein [Nitrospiraceae bacterium]
MKRIVMVVCAVVLFATAGAVRAEEKFGIPVYPGAKSDELAKKRCEFIDRTGKTAQCFRTSDDFSKVYAFYKKQANLEPPQIFATMPPNMQKDMLEGQKRHFDFCKKGSSDMCGFADMPAVRIMSPWSMNPNISPAAKPSEYGNKDVLLIITNK